MEQVDKLFGTAPRERGATRDLAWRLYAASLDGRLHASPVVVWFDSTGHATAVFTGNYAGVFEWTKRRGPNDSPVGGVCSP